MRDRWSSGYCTRGGVEVQRETAAVDADAAVEALVDALDERLGVLLASHYEYRTRYTRWDVGFVDPPLAIVAAGRTLRVRALNARGAVLLPAIEGALSGLRALAALDREDDHVLCATIAEPDGWVPEEQRSRQPSAFAVLRAIIDLFAADEDEHHGLYGAFGYDLALQFEDIPQRLPRPDDQRDLVLFLPDEIVVVDRLRGTAERRRYDFAVGGRTTAGLPREGTARPYRGADAVPVARDHQRGEFAGLVREAKQAFRRGDLFEVVAGQTFFQPCPGAPSAVFRRLRDRNPAPYAALMNLGEDEYLVAASPEMYVRVRGRRVESCPISGTIGRGGDALSDADRVLELLNSEKDAAELTMCTDVDRNDKSRVCEPGSVRILGRRQIEVYSKVIHTVDHVEGVLRDGFDALDAFLTHMWAVTVTGAPKLWAMRFLERHERSPRGWYGGAFGVLSFRGDIETGLTLRTVRIRRGVAEVRAGGTLLIDSDPEHEERETELKAAAFLDAVRRAHLPDRPSSPAAARPAPGAGRRVLLVDYEDSFVHTLANYLRQTGAEVQTVRGGGTHDRVRSALASWSPDLLFLSPGPGAPRDFEVGEAIDLAVERGLPVFGVCLGMQAIVEHFGGQLDVLGYPVHGKPSMVQVRGGAVFDGLPQRFEAGRYHSLYARRDEMPAALRVTAETDDGVVMAVEHEHLPIAAVQFHPESLMTLRGGVGRRLVENAVRLASPTRPTLPVR